MGMESKNNIKRIPDFNPDQGVYGHEKIEQINLTESQKRIYDNKVFADIKKENPDVFDKNGKPDLQLILETEAFKKWFGGDPEKLDEKDYNNMIDWCKMRTLEYNTKQERESIKYFKDQEMHHRKFNNDYEHKNLLGVMYEERVRKHEREINTMNVKIRNSGYEPLKDNMSKVMEKKSGEEGYEPIVLYRTTSLPVTKDGKLRLTIGGDVRGENKFEIGIYTGLKEHVEGRHKDKKDYHKENPFLYTCIVRARKPYILNSKNWPSDTEAKRKFFEDKKISKDSVGFQFDSIWIKDHSSEGLFKKDGTPNILEFISFNPDDVLVIAVEQE